MLIPWFDVDRSDFIAVNGGLPFVFSIAGGDHASLTSHENLKVRIAKRATAHVSTIWRCVLTIRSDTHTGSSVPMRDGANGLDSPSPQPAPILSIDELRSVVFIIRCARVIAFLQRFVPDTYLPPKEDRIPNALLSRLIYELKKLTPKWKWISSARALPRSPSKLGDELFYAITALRMSRIEIYARRVCELRHRLGRDIFAPVCNRHQHAREETPV